MKVIRNIAILMCFSLTFVAFIAAGASAEVLRTTQFTGTFTLPVQAQWGAMSLPAGDYTLRYGTTVGNGIGLVLVRRTAKGSPYGMILAMALGDTSTGENVLICAREGGTLYVRALEIPAIGWSVHFKIPHAVEVRSRLIANTQNNKTNRQLAEMLIQRITVTPKAN